MENSAAAKLVFSEDCRVERYLIPIGKSITRFEAKASNLCFIGVMFDIGFHCNIDAIRQASFSLYGKIMIRSAEMNNGIFINEARVDRSRRNDVSICDRRKPRLREAGGRAVSAGQFAGDNDVFGGRYLSAGRALRSERCNTGAENKENAQA